jgi:hypothetical protein
MQNVSLINQFSRIMILNRISCLSFYHLYSNEGSSIENLVRPGDVILSIDGFDCRTKDAQSLAEWLQSKPWVPQQVLLLSGWKVTR